MSDNKMDNGMKDHDLLIRIDQNLTNLIAVYESHVEEDKVMFENIKKENDLFKRVLYGGFGAFFIIQFLLNFGIINTKTKDRYFKSEATEDFSKVNNRLDRLEHSEKSIPQSKLNQ